MRAATVAEALHSQMKGIVCSCSIRLRLASVAPWANGVGVRFGYRISVVKCTPPVYRTPFARGGSMYPLEVYPPLGGLVVPLA